MGLDGADKSLFLNHPPKPFVRKHLGLRGRAVFDASPYFSTI